MNEHDDLRRALDDLVGRPPITLGRRGAVMSRISQVNSRRRVAMQASLSAFVVVGALLGAAQVIDAAPASKGSIVEETPAQDPAPVVSEKPTQAPVAEPKPTAAPVAKPKPEPTAEPTYVKPEPKPTYPKKAEPKPTYTKSEPVAGGLAVELYPYDTAKAGAEMSWKVKAYDTSGKVTSITVHFGDGSSKTYAPGTGCGEAVKQLAPHTYATAGTYTAKATVTTGGCGAATETKTVTASVKVLAAGAGNGPSAPTVTAQQVEAAIAKLALHGADADGWVKKFYVAWGDGTESYVGPKSWDGCQEGKPSSWDQYATHEYAAPGTYTVTVTVLSTDCSGNDGQTGSVTLTVTV